MKTKDSPENWREDGSQVRVPLARDFRFLVYNARGYSILKIVRLLGITESAIDTMKRRLRDKGFNVPNSRRETMRKVLAFERSDILELGQYKHEQSARFEDAEVRDFIVDNYERFGATELLKRCEAEFGAARTPTQHVVLGLVRRLLAKASELQIEHVPLMDDDHD